MRTSPHQSRFTIACCLTLLLPAARAEAQQPRLPRADASVSVGWLNANVSALTGTSDDWANRRATIVGQAGVYWTEHIKTEVMVEHSSSQQVWDSEDVRLPDGRIAFRYAHNDVTDTRVSIGQYYQFGHNAWTHVLVGGGLNLTRRGVNSDISPLVLNERNGSLTLEPGHSRLSSETGAAAFAAAAAKAYMTPRVFVRSEVQADVRRGIEAVVLRAGIGVDF